LVCAPHGRIENEKTIGFSFIGSLTHPIRNELMNSSIQHESKMRSYMMYNRHHDIDLYCEVMSKSTFSICPRGFGFSSFRICESLEQGAIPVYISDEFIFPEGQKAFEEYGVVIHRDEIQNIKSILESLTPEQIKYKQDAGRIAYQELYTFDGLRKWILNNI
jgi:hypothetical protein